MHIERIIVISVGNISINISKKDVTICVEEKCSKLSHRQAASLMEKAIQYIRNRDEYEDEYEEQAPEEEVGEELEEVEAEAEA